VSPDPLLEEVFKISGIPTHTFVKPRHSDRLMVSLRTKGRGVVIEGPSGIGKSTAVASTLKELGMDAQVLMLSARSAEDIEIIRELPRMKSFGVVVVDDFHRLHTTDQNEIADLLKILADSERADSKLVIIGINQAGVALISYAPDLANRIDRIRFESEPDTKITEMIRKGEAALNIEIRATESIVGGSKGSFYLAQLLCHEVCTQSGVTEHQDIKLEVKTLYSAVRREVMERQRVKFGPAVKNFVRGPKFRTGGRAPYFHILRWLTDSDVWSIRLPEEYRRHPNEKPSVKQVVDQNFLLRLCQGDDIAAILHYNSDAKTLSVEDPHLMYYLSNLDWPGFIAEVGFTNVASDRPYDVALTFTGEDRPFAEKLYDHLSEFELSVFYDKIEEPRILANNVEAVLGPAYQSDSRFVVAVLGPKYGEKRWTLFEASKYKHRIDKDEVIPIFSTKVPRNAFDPLLEKGGRTYDPEGDLTAQAAGIAEAISRRLAEPPSQLTLESR